MSAFAVEALDTEGFDRLAAGKPPRSGLVLPDPAISPPEVLPMLAAIAAGLSPRLDPNAWIVIEDGTVAALCSITSLAEPGMPVIGYGTAPSHQGRGAASAAVAAVLEWARATGQTAVMAETSTANLASQRVLENNGFVVAGDRIDSEDGPLLCWRWTPESSKPEPA